MGGTQSSTCRCAAARRRAASNEGGRLRPRTVARHAAFVRARILARQGCTAPARCPRDDVGTGNAVVSGAKPPRGVLSLITTIRAAIVQAR
jgi:hypothetical protein